MRAMGFGGLAVRSLLPRSRGTPPRVSLRRARGGRRSRASVRCRCWQRASLPVIPRATAPPRRLRTRCALFCSACRAGVGLWLCGAASAAMLASKAAARRESASCVSVPGSCPLAMLAAGQPDRGTAVDTVTSSVVEGRGGVVSRVRLGEG